MLNLSMINRSSRAKSPFVIGPPGKTGTLSSDGNSNVKLSLIASLISLKILNSLQT